MMSRKPTYEELQQRIKGLENAVFERERIEEALGESEEKYRTLIENAGEAIIVAQDGVIKFANPKGEKLYGRSQKELASRSLTDFIHDEDRDMVGERHKKRLRGEEISKTYPFRIINKTGDTKWVQLSAVPFSWDNKPAVLCYMTDITDLKQAEEALRESEEKYRSMMESMDDPTYICSPDYHVEYMNPAMANKTGRDAVGELCYRVLHELDEKCPWCVHDKVQQGESCVTEIVSPENNRIFNVSNSPIHHIDGSISKLTIYRDITEIKSMEQQLGRAQKMEAIGTLAGGVAHEFNNALMGVMGNIELLKMELPDDERKAKYLEAMNESGHRMSRLTDQLLAYSEGGKYNAENLKLDDFIIETLPILQHDLSPGVRVETRFQKMSYVRADQAQMQMVLSAIVANSNEAMEDGGIIRIAVENKDVDEDFTKQHPGLKPGPYVYLTIEDDGKGMDEETKDGLFEPFFTTKFQGRGMGMAAVYGIIKSHDGWIYVDSESGKGTVVRIYLPAVEAKEEAKAVKQPEAEIAMGEGTILTQVRGHKKIIV